MTHPQPTPPFAPAAAFARNRDTAPAYWMLGILWLVLVDGRETGGSYSVMEQLMPEGSGPRLLHVHPVDEWFYVLEGEMTAEVRGQTIVARASDSLWIPRGTDHRFTVTSPICRVLNGYTPAGFEQVIIGLAQPAEKRELPPPMEGPPDQTMVDKLFNNYWGADAADHWARFSPQWECDEHARAWPRRALRVVACCLIIRIPIIAVIAILPGINVAVR